MKISEIYKKFGVSPNLQEHMERAFGVVSLIEKHWKGQEKVDWDLTKKMALLHDLGNIVKFDFEKHPEFLGSERANIEYWKKIQAEMVGKYGSDDNEATKIMLMEIGIDQNVVDMIFTKRFTHSVETEKSSSWLLKILYYADLRALPLGIGTLEERLDDIRERYNPIYTCRPDFENLLEACRKIEKEIHDNLDFSVNDINNESVNQELITSKLSIENTEI